VPFALVFLRAYVAADKRKRVVVKKQLAGFGDFAFKQ